MACRSAHMLPVPRRRRRIRRLPVKSSLPFCLAAKKPKDRTARRVSRALHRFDHGIAIVGNLAVVQPVAGRARLQQDGRIESFDVCLLEPHGDVEGYLQLHGSSEQIATLREDEEFQRLTIDASLIVEDLRMVEGWTNEAIAQQMAMYQEAIAKVPQSA